MARPRAGRLRRVVLAAVLVGQLPGFALLAALVGPAPALLACALLSTPIALRLARGSLLDGLERGPRALALLAFYGWWGASLVAGVAFPATALAAHVAGATARTGAGWALAIGVLGGLLGVTWNRRPRLFRVEVPLAGLDPALDGYRIVQLSDLHMGGHTHPERIRRWVDRANALAPDLVAVTGDLITSGDAHLDDVGRELGRLRARDGAFACLGNHDYFCADPPRLVRALERGGLEVLRNRGRLVERGAARFFLGGVDDTWTRRADVARALAERPDGVPAIVLAHDPHLFDECRRRGAELVLSGHTHGGQLALPLLRGLNFARVAYRHTVGLYRAPREDGGGDAFLYVSRGAGTTGPPLRIGAPSEITLITLRAAPAPATALARAVDDRGGDSARSLLAVPTP